MITCTKCGNVFPDPHQSAARKSALRRMSKADRKKMSQAMLAKRWGKKPLAPPTKK